MRNLTLTLGLAVFALAGFYAGAKYELSRPAPAAAVGTAAAGGPAAGAGSGAGRTGTGAAPTAGTGGGFPGGVAGRGTVGQILSVSGSTLTLQDSQGNQVKVELAPSTTITKSVGGAQSDLTKGATVAIQGQRGTDGTVAATGITIVPGGSASPR